MHSLMNIEWKLSLGVSLITYLSSEVFPPHFNVIRKDCEEGSGDV